jgi:hypothetical protein
MPEHRSYRPRPEAREMKWDELLRPVGKAVRDLLVRLDATVDVAARDNTAFARCFLVTGERGTGKTTVLLTARSFSEHPPKLDAKPELERVCRRLHDRVRWLPMLDLEPVSPKANLLTLLLVQLRSALLHSTTAGTTPATPACSSEPTRPAAPSSACSTTPP